MAGSAEAGTVADGAAEVSTPSRSSKAAAGRPSRRRLLALGAGATAAAVAALGLEARGRAASGDPLVVGAANSASPGDVTALTGDVPGTASVLVVENLSADRGDGLTVVSRGGFSAPWSPWGAGPSIAVRGSAKNADGTAGGAGHGVWGSSGTGSGVVGEAAEGGIGVRGVAPGDSPAVQAYSGTIPPTPDGGLALDVVGKARFSTAGAGVARAGSRTTTVTSPAVTEQSHVTVTFTGSPGLVFVTWVERQPGTGFVVHLSGRPRWDVPFTYLIVEPGA